MKLRPEDLAGIKERTKALVNLQDNGHSAKITVHMGTCGIAAGARKILSEVTSVIEERNLRDVQLTTSGCAGLCSKEPMATVELKGEAPVKYIDLTEEKIRRIFADHVLGKKIVSDFALAPLMEEVDFFSKQRLIALRNRALIDPEKVDECIARSGYEALAKVLSSMKPEDVLEEIKDSGLRGRGGAGFPTGLKWELCRNQPGDVKYIVCNGDEGDPGAFMDRSIIESDPHSVLEGMIIGAYAIGASSGFIYIRNEYPLAIERMLAAMDQAREYGLLGENIFRAGFNFDAELKKGAGAFVCGEETSLMASIEGRSPEPRQRPPFPAQSGIFGCPTNINNVETWANVPEIINRGSQWFSSIGTELSKGTKVFSLVGKVNNTGLVEVPMGITLKEIIFDIGGGIPQGRRFKAVQTGGPSGGCIPNKLIDLPVDYERLQEVGSMMGSGGMVVMDEDTCMVDIAKYFLSFTNDESCGKCNSCREGSEALLDILTRISEGRGREDDIDLLEELGEAIRDASQCGLGQTLSNPVLSTLRYFREEYEAHIKYKRCPAVVCQKIISSPCQYSCPLKTDVPAYNTLIAQGKFSEALELIRESNPLPIICGRVCMSPCMDRCRAKEIGESVRIRELKRFVTDYELEKGSPPVEPYPKVYEEKIAVIGSGPAGLTASYYLCKKGYSVTIFESLPVAGGMLAVGIPAYRLPRNLLNLEIDRIRQAGVEIRTGSPVSDLDALLQDGYGAILLATGAHKGRKLGIPGEDAEGVLDALTFLRKVNLGEDVPVIGKRIGIVGGGDTAIDTARTALRLGAEEVQIIYRRTRAEMPAIEEEIEAALDEGIKIEFLTLPTKVVSVNGELKVECIPMLLSEPDESGRRRPIPIDGLEIIFELDTLIPAVAQQPELTFISGGAGLAISEKGTVVADPETFVTKKEGIFVAGDIATGPLTVTNAMASAKIAAESIHRFLRGGEQKREYDVVRPERIIKPVEISDEEMDKLTAQSVQKLPVDRRISNFDEVELGFTAEMAMMEAKRCLRCDFEEDTA